MPRFRLFGRRTSTKSTDTIQTTETSQTSSRAGSTTTRTPSQSNIVHPSPSLPLYQPTPVKSPSLTRLREKFLDRAGVPDAVPEQRESVLVDGELPQKTPAEREPSIRRSGSETLAAPSSFVEEREKTTPESVHVEELKLDDLDETVPPALVLQEPTPDVSQIGKGDTANANARIVKTLIEAPVRRHEHLHSPPSTALPTGAAFDYFTPGLPDMTSMLHRKIWVRRPGASATLVQIREDDLVDDVRDMILKKYANSLGRTFDAPDMTLRIVQRAEQGQQRYERLLGPEEEMCRTIDTYYPGGQTVEDALVIDVPQRRTPRPSPKPYQQAIHQASYADLDEYRPLENGTEYFPPMPAIVPPSVAQTSGSHDSRGSVHPHHPSIVAPLDHHQRSISVLNTGQIPPLPSPGTARRRHDNRPRFPRQHTSSPTAIPHASNSGAVILNAPNLPPNLNPNHALVHRGSTRPRMDSSASDAHSHANGVPAPPPLPTPPAPEAPPTNNKANGSSPPTPLQGVTPIHGQRPTRPRKSRQPTSTQASSRTRQPREGSQVNGRGAAATLGPNSMLDGSVPPINVLIVEDNIINLRILEGLMKRLKVRWQTAMNGQIAVDKWRAGGFHLVLMDIQMPVMNGLAATKEIRRLERVNGIGVFSSSTPTSPVDGKKGKGAPTNGDLPDGEGANGDPPEANGHSKDDDKLQMSDGFFKSPIIIVALTASSLQSDRHEALAAGCNDFLTKPVNFVWLERKVKEWGCMQALIDFDGWRRWKDYAAMEEAGKSEEQRRVEREKEEKQRVKMEKFAKLQEKQRLKREEDERKKKRASINVSEAGKVATDEGALGAAETTGSGGVNGIVQEEG
ncbi:hypothetical protein LTR85_002441 [Meristemomyces frigidus]|nr:hypothetical protein LTR85_002441 [Meristemomyces frigidus]